MGHMASLDAGVGFARPGYPQPNETRAARDHHGSPKASRISRQRAGAEGLEPPAYGFGDRRSTN